ncbi:UDP-glucose:glycoprotein glucosyltransferase 1, partial [Ophiophagus hannah]
MMTGPMPLFVAGMLFLSIGRRGAESAPRKAVTARLGRFTGRWGDEEEARWVRLGAWRGVTAPAMRTVLFPRNASSGILYISFIFLFFFNIVSEHSYYDLLLKKAGQFLSNLQINLLKFSLSLRAFSPTIQMFQQIAALEPPPKGCNAFVVIHGKSTCKINEIKKLLMTAPSRPKPYLFKGDHKFPVLKEPAIVAILYAEVGTKDFATFHNVLSEKAQKGEFVYILRHFVKKRSTEKMYLSGYGVELAIKSTEYKAMDESQVEGTRNRTEEEDNKDSEVQGFLFDTLTENHPDLKDNLKELKKYLIESSDNTEPLKLWELKDISLQAASQILSAPVYNALRVMKDIAQNFPVKARSLTRVLVNQQMRKEIEENQKRLHESLELKPGEARLFLNGLPIDLDLRDPFSILETLKIEGKAMHILHSLGIKGDLPSKFMRLASQSQDASYALDIRHSAIVWVNNIETDAMYNKWPSSFQELLKPAYAGMMRQIRRNLYNMILFIDPLQEEAAGFIKLIELIYTQKVPLSRLGFVFILNTDEVIDGNKNAGVALWRAFNFIADEVDIPHAFVSLFYMYRQVEDGRILSVDNVKRILYRQFPQADMEEILGPDSYYDDRRKGLLNDHKDAVDFIMEQQNVVSHINDRILDDERRYLNFESPSVEILTFFFSDDALTYPVTMWIVADYDKSDGRQLLSTALKHVKSSSHIRLGIVNNPTSKVTEDSTIIARAIMAAFVTQKNFHLKNFLGRILKEETAMALSAGTKIKKFFSPGMDTDALEKKYNTMGVDLIQTHQIFCQEVLKLLPGEMAVISNGRLYFCLAYSFYRLVMEPELSVGPNNFFPLSSGATFLEIPESLLLTLNMATPESWLVEAVNSSYDLDNIHLKDVEGVVSAEYELEYLLLEGHCYDVSTRKPPRGLQFTLGRRNNPFKVDTIVMANLGYFQLKANPGSWILRLREGRSEEIYEIFQHEGTDSSGSQEEVIVVLNSFRSKTIRIQVQKKPDSENEDLLNEVTTEEDDSMGSFTGRTWKTDLEKKTDVLNIFSVASGHLYERFLRVMMLSVLRHTKTPVKFWFLKNYLSPMFKALIPHMAKEYGFDYELVQYKWPHWLHKEIEKQRIIWGYKILFLDVLFPLAVEKIIFVDADQVVRSDLKELRDLNLRGAPYGYTPFCDSRREMDGYRFWKSGYWASHLGKKKYHISALYVVDLKIFRKIAAGDRLRGQYQALSQDPNSLSNLDQDLPNNMIHQVPIKSLPQEWLWCETWCSIESKAKAKTIDLCNNPKTKEPKLEAAIRIVPEWTDYDSEIQKLINHIRKEKTDRNPSHPKESKHDEL